MLLNELVEKAGEIIFMPRGSPFSNPWKVFRSVIVSFFKICSREPSLNINEKCQWNSFFDRIKLIELSIFRHSRPHIVMRFRERTLRFVVRFETSFVLIPWISGHFSNEVSSHHLDKAITIGVKNSIGSARTTEPLQQTLLLYLLGPTRTIFHTIYL